MTRLKQNDANESDAPNVSRKNPRTERSDAIRLMAEMPDSLTDSVLFWLLDDNNDGVRQNALEVLAERNEVLGRIGARAMLGDNSRFARHKAAKILGEIGKSIDVHRLGEALQDSDWMLRAEAAESLGRTGGSAAWPILKKAMVNDANPIVRREAAFAFCYCPQEKFIPDLEQALSEETSEQALIGLLAALYALGQQERLTQLFALLRSENSSIRHATLNTLKRIIRPNDCAEAVHALHELIACEDNPGVRTDAKLAAEYLTTLVQAD